MTRPAPFSPPPRPARPAAGEPPATPIELREMRWWDIDPVLLLERDLYPEDAWSRGMFWSELAHARGPGATRRYVVAEADGRLHGYAGLAVSGGLGDVQTIAVVRERWGTGLGARLLTDLLRHATEAECSEVMLEVRVDNVRAQRLYERFGFRPVGIRRGYYQPGNVDALVMQLVTAPRTDGAPRHGSPPGAALDPARPPHPAADPVRAPHPSPAANTQERQGPETHG